MAWFLLLNWAMKTLKLTNSELLVKVDDDDYSYLSKYRWHLAKGYARVKLANSPVLMHRKIMMCPKGLYVHHKNHDGLDNQRHNLVVCTSSQNLASRSKNKNNTSGFKGVWLARPTGKWVAEITIERKARKIGHFFSKEDAARAYDKEALRYFGEFAVLNFPVKL